MDVNKELVGLALGIEPDNLLTAQETASMVGIQHRSILKAISRKRLPATKVGGQWYIKQEDARKYREETDHDK